MTHGREPLKRSCHAPVCCHRGRTNFPRHCRYFAPNGSSTTGTLSPDLITAAIAQAKANPYDTFTIVLLAGPSLPQGEVRPASLLYATAT